MKKLPKKSSAGPPFRTGKPTTTTGVRLDAGELAQLDAAAKLMNCSRGDVLRQGGLRLAEKVITQAKTQNGT